MFARSHGARTESDRDARGEGPNNDYKGVCDCVCVEGHGGWGPGRGGDGFPNLAAHRNLTEPTGRGMVPAAGGRAEDAACLGVCVWRVRVGSKEEK